MDKLFETSTFNRKVFAKMLKEFSYKELVCIPKGFNNSIFWNIAHVVVTQQLLMYKLSGQKVDMPTEIVDRYKKGTTPTEDIPESDIEYIQNNMFDLNVKAESDYKAGMFKDFQNYPTSTKIELQSVEDAIQFNTFHEGIHLGVIMSLKKFVR